MPEELFERASRLKIRFETDRGHYTTEDLWDLPLTSASRISLDQIAIHLYQELRSRSDVVSFVNDSQSPASDDLQLRFEVVKHIIDVKKAAKEAATQARKRAELKERMLEALDRKQQGSIDAMSEEDLRKKIAELE